VSLEAQIVRPKFEFFIWAGGPTLSIAFFEYREIVRFR
jgi:hypothetical protein